jgi:hypothetical protein
LNNDNNDNKNKKNKDIIDIKNENEDMLLMQNKSETNNPNYDKDNKNKNKSLSEISNISDINYTKENKDKNDNENNNMDGKDNKDNNKENTIFFIDDIDLNNFFNENTIDEENNLKNGLEKVEIKGKAEKIIPIENFYVNEDEINLHKEFFNLDSFSNFFTSKKRLNKSDTSSFFSSFNNSKFIGKKVFNTFRKSKSLDSSDSKSKYSPAIPNLVFISDFFPKFQQFGLMDVPLFLDLDYIRLLKMTLPQHINTLNELKENFISEISREAKILIEKNKENEEENNKYNENESKIDIKINIFCDKDKDSKYNENYMEDYEKIVNEFVSYKDQADIYIENVKKIDKDNIYKMICYIYSMNGFIKSAVNNIMCDFNFDLRTNLNSFILILLSVIKFDAVNNSLEFFSKNNILYEDDIFKKKFIRVYKELNCTEKSLIYYKEKIKKEKENFIDNLSKLKIKMKIKIKIK